MRWVCVWWGLVVQELRICEGGVRVWVDIITYQQTYRSNEGILWSQSGPYQVGCTSAVFFFFLLKSEIRLTCINQLWFNWCILIVWIRSSNQQRQLQWQLDINEVIQSFCTLYALFNLPDLVRCAVKLSWRLWQKMSIEYLPSFCIIRSDEQGYRYRGECEHPEK